MNKNILTLNNAVLCYLPKVNEFTDGGVRKTAKEIQDEKYNIKDKTLVVARDFERGDMVYLGTGDKVILREYARPELIKSNLFVENGFENEMIIVDYHELALVIRKND